MEKIDETTPVQQPVPEPAAEEPKNNTMRNIGIGVAVLLVVAAIGAAIDGLTVNPPLTAVLRDIAIIVLALVTIIIGLLLALLLFQIQSLIVLLRDEIKPILRSTNETVSTVKGTTSFVSDAVVRPMIDAASMTAGVVGSLRALTRTNGRKQRRKRSRGGQQ